MYYGSAILPLRRLFLCEKELEDCKARIARHKNKWYRRLFYKYIKGNLKRSRMKPISIITINYNNASGLEKQFEVLWNRHIMNMSI